MISPEVRSKYKVTIGIECHVQLKTASKLFSAVSNDAKSAEPNTLVSHIDFGLPGALPVLNEKALELAAQAAFALSSVPQKFSKFDRKHYFYPDLPMGYQISQFDQPIILGGHVDIEVDGEKRTIGITRAHLEADAGKSTHPQGKNYSLVDLNRAGTPLLEIVSEPDMHTALEARQYVRELYLLMRSAGVSDCDLFYGNMRFDVNVSVSQTDVLGTRTETKNINSFKSVEKTVEYEVERQIEVIEKGGQVVQETRGFDDSKQKTFSQRIKENADDYRYMPDPDLPPVVLSDQFIKSIKDVFPEMPGAWRTRLAEIGIDKAHIEVLIESNLDYPEAGFLNMLSGHIKDKDYTKFLANNFVNFEIPLRREEGASINPKIDRTKLYAQVYSLSKDSKLSSTNVKQTLREVLLSDKPIDDIEDYAKDKGYLQESDSGRLNEIVKKVVEANPKAADDIAAGELKAVGFLVGQVMKESKGQANPGIAQQLIKQYFKI